MGKYLLPARFDALLPRDRRERKGDIGQHVEQVALLGIDHALISRKLLAAKAFLGQALQQRLARIRLAPERRSSSSSLNSSGSSPNSRSMNCGRRHRLAVRRSRSVVAIMCWMVRSLPSASLILIFCGRLRLVLAAVRRLPAIAAVAAGLAAASRAWRHRLDRLAVPFRIVEVLIGLHEVVDREIVLAVEQPRAAADDLLELDHRIDRPHQHDVAHVARVDAGRKLLRRGQDRRDGLFVVLERRAATGRRARRRRPSPARSNSDRLLVFIWLIRSRTSERVVLRGAEHQRLLALVDLRP